MTAATTAPLNTSHQALYRACMKEAAAQGRSLMQHLVARARRSMPKRATMAPDAQERNLLTEAARILMKHEGALCEAFPQALLAEFAQAIAGDTRRTSALSFDSLELMGDEQVLEGVELVRTQQAVLVGVQPELTELNALMCAVQGLKSVRAERNPLRPEIYVRSLRSVTLKSPVSAAVRTRWMQHMGEAMGPELASIYRELSGMLRRGGVSGAAFDVIPGAEAPTAGAMQLAAPALASAETQAKALLNVDVLRRLLSGEFDVESSGGPVTSRPADFSVTMPAAFEALQEMKQVDQVMQRLRHRQAAGLIDSATGTAALRDQLRKGARGTGQALGLEVVSLMVENIADDPRLLPAVQQAVRDLEPALLRLVLSDPRFFSDKKHPARQLLEQMTQRSLAWRSADASGFATFLLPLQEAVQALSSTHVSGAEPFDFALTSLAQAWGDQEKHDRWDRERAVRVLLQAEQRNLLAAKVAREHLDRADVAGAPREVVTFVTGPWSQVIAQARLADQSGTADPGGYGDFVADLISSAQPRLGPGNAARLARLVPPLLAQLRHGLSSIDYPAIQTQRFLDELAALHQQALKLPAATGGLDQPFNSWTREELEQQFNGDSHGGAWLAPSEAQHSGFMATHELALPGSLFHATQPDVGATLPPPGQEPEISPVLPDGGLQPGVWVELFMDAGWARHQLTWASPHATLFMFTNAVGKTHTMTRRLLDKMLLAGSLRVVSAQAVVDGALDAVAHVAARNSLEIQV